MTKSSQLLPANLRRFRRTALLLTITCLLAILTVQLAHSQTFTVIHGFTGQRDGGNPSASLTIDGAGNLYGTTYGGGGVIGNDCAPSGCGIVFKMAHHSAGWVLTPLYPFYGQTDGAGPIAPVIFGPGGLLYGSTTNGGRGDCILNFIGCGVVFTVQPSPTACHTALCAWTEDPIYQFLSQTDGIEPINNIVFDPAGHLYGTTFYGGTASCFGYGCGTVFQLTNAGPSWTKTPVYNFTGQADGAFPSSGVVIDRFGILYGTTQGGGAQNFGTVFRVTPSGSGWTETVIYNFQNGSDGAYPFAGLVMDVEGNLYGTTITGGAEGGGTVFELSPSGEGWTFSVIKGLSGAADGGPQGALAFDGAGNLYGTTLKDGAHRCGNVFKLTHSGGQWGYTDLYDFTCGDDGGYPEAGVTLDAGGNIYGTADGDGPNQNCAYGYGTGGCGVIWEITP